MAERNAFPVLVRLSVPRRQRVFLAFKCERRAWKLGSDFPFLWRWVDDVRGSPSPGAIEDFTREEDSKDRHWIVTGNIHRQGDESWLQAQVVPSTDASAFEYCWFTLWIRAESAWRGRLAIYGALNESRRNEHVIRRRLTVAVDKPLPG